MAPDPQKREARRFEPPPWERERFEELEKRGGTGSDGPAVEERSVESGSGNEVASDDPARAVLGEADAMLLALKAEEPDTLEGAWKVGAAASVFVTTIGLMLVVWGSVAMARAASAGAAGVMGSAIMSVMGALFTALGVWLGVRSLRQRGVL